jgi:hypothetical protein
VDTEGKKLSNKIKILFSEETFHSFGSQMLSLLPLKELQLLQYLIHLSEKKLQCVLNSNCYN